MSEAERFVTSTPVYDSLAEDEAALAALEADIRGPGWIDCVETAGGVPVGGEPELSRVPNLLYGRVMCDEDDNPILRDDGSVFTDPVKFVIIAEGWAVRA